MNIPWRVRRSLERWASRLAYTANRFANGGIGRPGTGRRICFACSFHGITGATIAIARLANLLARDHSVSFVTTPASDLNRLLSRRVRMVMRADPACEVHVVNGAYDLDEVSRWRRAGKTVVVTINSLPASGAALAACSVASKVHFVSDIQVERLQPRPDPASFFVAPNYCEPYWPHRRSRNVGIVGRVRDPAKQVAASVRAAIASDARAIHVWGGAADDLPGELLDRRLRVHPWSMDKTRIYDSFDVLVSMSIQESFGLVVIEALSAGIPCVLSNIPAHRKFADCPGVIVLNPTSGTGITRAIEALLDVDDETRTRIHTYWEAHYSARLVLELWNRMLRSPPECEPGAAASRSPAHVRAAD